MLREVLRLAIARGTARDEELARALGASPELVHMALAELVRSDYLQAVVPGCAAPCEHCSAHAACLGPRGPRVWRLTRKGAAWVDAGDVSPASEVPT